MRTPLRILIVLSLVIIGIIGTSTVALADPPEKTDGFICPVLGGQAGENGNQELTYIGDGVPPFYTVVGPDVSVPTHATNGDGTGVVHGAPHAAPGDTDYTAIWDYDAQ